MHSDLRNPIEAAKSVLEQGRVMLSNGRVPPLLLCGNGALRFSMERGLAGVLRVTDQSSSPLITEDSMKKYQRYIRMLNYEDDAALNHDYGNDTLQDTVGAVSIATSAASPSGYASVHVAAGVSSGGLWLKHSGRIGEAAVHGAGCWAATERVVDEEEGGVECMISVGCSVSGTGEQIIRTAFARRLVESILADRSTNCDYQSIIKEILEEFLETPSLAVYEERLIGFLLLIRDERCGAVELWCGHTTETMGIGYAITCSAPNNTGDHSKSNNARDHNKFLMSRKPAGLPFTLFGQLITSKVFLLFQ